MTSLQTKYLSSMPGTTDIAVNDGTDKPIAKRTESVETCEESVTSDDECDDTDYDNESFDSDDDDDDDDDYSLNSDIDIEEEVQQEKPCQATTVAEKKSGLFLSLEMVKMLRISTSCENFNKLVEDETIQNMIPPTRSSSTVDVKKQGSKMVFAIQTEASMTSHISNNINDKTVPKPKDMLFQLLCENNISVETKSYETIKDTFVTGDVSGYSLELMKAVKQGDVDYLRSLIGTQKTFQCSNKFGESIVHATARHGHLNVLQFLIEEVNVSMSVVCDTGRNPLHDSCWTAKPNFDCIEYMINQYPEYLLITDKRGYTPLEYAPIDSHKAWSQFLNEKKDLLIQLLKEKLDIQC